MHEQETPAVREATCQIEEYLHGKRREFDMAIDWSILGSDFQRGALQAVMAIPYGETRTYGEIAAQIGTPECTAGGRKGKCHQPDAACDTLSPRDRDGWEAARLRRRRRTQNQTVAAEDGA